ncbi:MAG: dephospho-CoA kinase [Ruminococcus sp.]|nr:dephospho-CoA kinase [Ruminococcus sp.]
MSASKPFIIGLTGQTGAGKTTVAKIMTEVYGSEFLPHIDCDRVTRNIVDEDAETYADILRRFPDFFTDGRFDRRKAAGLLFADSRLLARYDAAIFPHITRLINGIIDGHARDFARRGEGMILLDAPMLFESGIDRMCDVIVSCIAPERLRMERIIARDGITEQQAKARISAQHDDEFFRGRSDYIIENIGGEAALERAAADVMDKIVTENV